MNALSSLSSIYSSNAARVQVQIDAIQSQIDSGSKTLSTSEQSEVASLSAKSTSLAAIDTSIAQAKNIVSVAKTGLDSIAGILTQMQRLAGQASTPGLDNSDFMFFNMRYQHMLTQVGECAIKAQLNGANLLSGTAVLNVKTGIEINPASNMVIQPVNIMRMISAGILGGTRIDDGQSAMQALDAVRAAMATVSNGTFQLKLSTRQLDDMSKLNTVSGSSVQDRIQSLQTLDAPSLQAQLQLLKNQQSIDYQLMNQFSAKATSFLTIMV